MSKDLKFGYEGEGPLIGRRTAYASYPLVRVQDAVNVAEEKRVDALYYVVDRDHEEFVSSLLQVQLRTIKAVTLDFHIDYWIHFKRLGFTLSLVRCDLSTIVDVLSESMLHAPNTYIKMVCEDAWQMKDFIVKANEIARAGYIVLLMPDFWKDSPHLVGVEMMKYFDVAHPGVRIMPPVHHILGMP